MGFMKDLTAALLGRTSSAVAVPRGPGSGAAPLMPIFRPYRGTTNQVCGLWPFVVGGNTPLVGAPLGRAIDGSGTVCADPISWFEKGLISAPSGMVLGLNGLGKSSLLRRIILASSAFGVHTMVLGDIKPDYVDLMEALGGQIISIGHGTTGINPLDAGNVAEALELLAGSEHEATRAALLAAAHERKKQTVSSLIHIIRRSSPSDREETILDEAIRLLEETRENARLSDLLDVIRSAHPRLIDAAIARGDAGKYREIVEPLEASLMALLAGRFGGIFASEKTTPMMMDRPVVFDVHALLDVDEGLQSAVLLACWSYGFATVEIAQTLADAGVAPRRRYQIVMDELWRILRASSGLVERVDALTRLNRSVGVGQLMVTHSMTDLTALPDEADRIKAAGFVERSKMLFLGGLPLREMEHITSVVSMTEAEKHLLSSWNAPGAYDPLTGRETPPVGRGKFLLKTGSNPGIPFQVQFVAGEAELSDTNKRWATKGPDHADS